MIIGVGCDLVNIKRINSLWQKFTDRFINRILGTEEQQIFYQLSTLKQLPYLAKRFAAKEAVAKALKTGIGRGLSFHDIQILNDNLGAPFVVLSTYFKYSNMKIDISIADESSTALAFAVISSA